VGAPVDSPRAIGAVAGALLDAVDVGPGVRLFGVSVSLLARTERVARQLSFDDQVAPAPAPVLTAVPGPGPGLGSGPGAASGASDLQGGGGEPPPRHSAWDEVEAAVSAIRARYGNASVGPAALVGQDGLAVKERGDTQWGPTDPSSSRNGHR
jgi:hypothetical protein